jgi:hypothetical protein
MAVEASAAGGEFADEGWDGYASGLRLLSVRLESSSMS